jgi:hypothetical protein
MLLRQSQYSTIPSRHQFHTLPLSRFSRRRLRPQRQHKSLASPQQDPDRLRTGHAIGLAVNLNPGPLFPQPSTDAGCKRISPHLAGDFDAIESLRQDAFFKSALELAAVPFSPTLRQRMDTMAESGDAALTAPDETNGHLLRCAKHARHLTLVLAEHFAAFAVFERHHQALLRFTD